jgi:FkbM family methyltransferase
LKFRKLITAALLAFLACVALLYVLDADRFRWNYRCWRYAVSRLECLTAKTFEFEVELLGARYKGSTDNYVDRHIFFYGAFEKPILFFLRDVMASAYSNRGVFLDIGANTGEYSLFMSKYAAEIHAFEPWHPVLKRFQEMVQLNHIKNIVSHPYGIGNSNSKQPFYKPSPDNLGTGSFVSGFKGGENSYDGELEIQIGDDAVKRAGLKSVDLIKMDIEGYEKPALEGLRKTLRTYRPIVEFELSIDPKGSVSIKTLFSRKKAMLRPAGIILNPLSVESVLTLLNSMT